jgi:hypothetical protein
MPLPLHYSIPLSLLVIFCGAGMVLSVFVQRCLKKETVQKMSTQSSQQQPSNETNASSTTPVIELALTKSATLPILESLETNRPQLDVVRVASNPITPVADIYIPPRVVAPQPEVPQRPPSSSGWVSSSSSPSSQP